MRRPPLGPILMEPIYWTHFTIFIQECGAEDGVYRLSEVAPDSFAQTQSTTEAILKTHA